MDWIKHTRVNIIEGNYKIFLEKYSNDDSLLVTSQNSFKRNFIDIPNNEKFFWEGNIFWINKIVDINQIYENQINLINKKIKNVIAFGGGTAIDTAKIITLLNTTHSIIYSNNKFEIEELTNKKSKPILITIPTTNGTGSEVTSFATCWDFKNHKKYSFESTTTLAKESLLDSNLLKSLPKHIRVNTGLDTFSHLLEVLWNKNFEEYMFDDILIAIKNTQYYLKMLALNNIEKELDKKMQIASCLAGTLIQVTKTAAAHSISYPLTSIFDIPHGVAVSFTLPNLLLFNSRGKRKNIILKAALELGFKSIEDWSKSIIVILKDLNINNNLRPIQESSKWQDYVEEMFTPSRMKNNCEELSQIDVKQILENSLKDFSLKVEDK